MNYYSYYPLVTPKPSLFGNLFRGINFHSILSGTQKALNLANQAIPLIKQAAPMFQNAKTMFRVINEFRKTDSPSVNKVSKVSNDNNTNKMSDDTDTLSDNNVVQTGGPTFFFGQS